MNLPAILDAKSVDVFMNVESSHCYGDIEAFFRGVVHALKDDGTFVYIDYRMTVDMEDFLKVVKKYFDIVNFEDVTKKVARSLRLQDDDKQLKLKPLLPWYHRLLFNDFAGTTDSLVYREYEHQVRSYFAY